MNKKTQKTTDRAYYLFAMRAVGDFGATIAVPVIIFVLVGQYLDSKYNLYPYLTIIGFILAALISIKIIHKKAKKYGNDYQRLVDNESINKKN